MLWCARLRPVWLPWLRGMANSRTLALDLKSLGGREAQ